MKIVKDNFEGEDFVDILLTRDEAQRLLEYSLICGETLHNNRLLSFGLKLDDEEEYDIWE